MLSMSLKSLNILLVEKKQLFEKIQEHEQQGQ